MLLKLVAGEFLHSSTNINTYRSNSGWNF